MRYELKYYKDERLCLIVFLNVWDLYYWVWNLYFVGCVSFRFYYSFFQKDYYFMYVKLDKRLNVYGLSFNKCIFI